MDLKIVAKFLETGVENAKTHALLSASLDETVFKTAHIRQTDDVMKFDVGAYSEGVQPAEATVLIKALRTAHVSAADIGKAIDQSSLPGYYQEMLHAANGGV